MSNCKNIWRTVYDQALMAGLIGKLPQSNPKQVLNADSVSWHNVAPRTQKSVTLGLSNAGVLLTASSQNASVIHLLHEKAKDQIDRHYELEITPIREWMTGQRNFSIRCTVATKKAGVQSRADALYKALDLIIEMLQPYV